MKTRTIIISLAIILLTSCSSPLSSRMDEYVSEVEANCKNWTAIDLDAKLFKDYQNARFRLSLKTDFDDENYILHEMSTIMENYIEGYNNYGS